MNVRELKKNIGTIVKLFPTPRRDRTGGPPLADQFNRWMILLSDDSGGFQFTNTITNHVLELKVDNIKEYRTPDFIFLRGQVILEPDNTIRFEPFVQAPEDFAGLFDGQAQLRVLVNDRNDLIAFRGGGPMNIRVLKFRVENTGDRPTRDFHVTILVPQNVRLAGSFRPFTFMDEGKKTVGTKDYAVYTRFVDMPIYPASSLKVDDLILSIPEGEHSILWKITSADGKFPPGGQWGSVLLSIEPA